MGLTPPPQAALYMRCCIALVRLISVVVGRLPYFSSMLHQRSIIHLEPFDVRASQVHQVRLQMLLFDQLMLGHWLVHIIQPQEPTTQEDMNND
jgi:hypothetical protein